MAVVEDVLPLGEGLERSYIAHVAGRLKFRVGSIVYVAFSLDETIMGFAFPKDERDALIASDPRFHLPGHADLRYHWVHATLAELDADRGARAGRRGVADGGAAEGGPRVRPDPPGGAGLRAGAQRGSARPLTV